MAIVNTFLMSLLISSINVRCVKDATKCVAVLDYLKHVRSDVFFLQECGIPEKTLDQTLEGRWDCGPSYWSGCNRDRNAGVGILLKSPAFVLQRVERVVHGRLLCVDGKWDGQEIRLVNVYCPTDLQKRVEVLKMLPPLLLCNRRVILGGDFNCIISVQDRASASAVTLDNSSWTLLNMIQDLHMQDSFRTHCPQDPGYTWTSSNSPTRSRIDFLFTDSSLGVTSAEIIPVFFSDHSLLKVGLTLPQAPL